MSAPVAPLALHALFQRRVAGDEALLKLARLRFLQAGLAAEVYAGSPGELDWVLDFVPHPGDAAAGSPLPVVHLGRDIDLLSAGGRAAVAAFADGFAGRVAGLVVHDRAAMAERPHEAVAALGALAPALGDGTSRPRLFLEYAAGMAPEVFLDLAARVDVPEVSVCLDAGHVGIRQARHAFGQRHPGLDLAALRPRDPRLRDLMPDVAAAVATALPTLLDLVRGVGALGKPLHLHLHDGHPLIPGLSDHFSFLTQVPIPFEYAGRRALDPMYGPRGLAAIVAAAVAGCSAGASFTLEIHQAEGRLPLQDAAELFSRWTDTTNAERMNYWLAVLAANAQLVRSLPIGPAPGPG